MPDSGPPTPDIISHYRLERRIGGGAMGQVFHGTDRRDDSPVAIKLMWPHLAMDSSFRSRFEKEAHVATLLHSPYTVKLFDFGYSAGWYYLVMEYVDGESLAQRLRRGAMPAHEAVGVALDVARALEEAETRRIVHRDLKPENVLLTREGMARVADFGIARDAAGGAGTVAGAFLGTATYAAPEQAHGSADYRSDQYALGATLYHMVAGRPPFEGSLFDLIRQHESASVPVLPLAGAPGDLVAVIHRCMAKAPEDRYHSAADLVAALSAIETSTARQAAAAELAETLIDVAEDPLPALDALAASPGPVIAATAAPVGQPAPFATEVPAGKPPPPFRPAPDRATVAAAAGSLAPAARTVSAVAGAALWPAAIGVIVTFGMFFVLTVVAIVLTDRQLALGPYADFSDLQERDDAKDAALGFQLLGSVLTWPFLAWFGWRFTAPLRKRGGESRNAFTRASAAWTWLVPFVNLAYPFVPLHRAAPLQGPAGPLRALTWAWCAVTLTGVGFWFAVFALDPTPAEDLSAKYESVEKIFAFQIVIAALTVVGAGCVFLLARLSRRDSTPG